MQPVDKIQWSPFHTTSAIEVLSQTWIYVVVIKTRISDHTSRVIRMRAFRDEEQNVRRKAPTPLDVVREIEAMCYHASTSTTT